MGLVLTVRSGAESAMCKTIYSGVPWFCVAVNRWRFSGGRDALTLEMHTLLRWRLSVF